MPPSLARSSTGRNRPARAGSVSSVIVIVADDLGYGDLGAFGNELVATPHLDRLAAEGVALTQHYSASPMCAPARASLLTGRYNHRTGAVDVPSNRGLDRICLSERTVADRFAAAGYATGMVGKWHNGHFDRRYHPNQRGFDEFAGFLNGGMDYWRWVLDRNGVQRPADGRYLTDVFADEAASFVRRHAGEPFFLYVAFNAPHRPFQAPEHLLRRYRERGDLTEAVCAVYAMVEAMDRAVGQLLETVEECGLSQDTVVLFTSDNGPDMGGQVQQSAARYNGRFSGSKGDVLEGGIRVPALVRAPALLPAGRRCDEVVHFADWLPTLAGLAGVQAQGGKPLDGVDVAPALRGEAAGPEREHFWQWNRYEPVAHCNAAMRDGPWKLVWPSLAEARVKDPSDDEPYRLGLTSPHRLGPLDTGLPERALPPPQPPRLFDLSRDPFEQVDLAAQHPDRVRRMACRWEAWFETVTAEWRRAYAAHTALS